MNALDLFSNLSPNGTNKERKQLDGDVIASLAPKRKRRLVYDRGPLARCEHRPKKEKIPSLPSSD
jgi:hypothetical protein